MVIEALDHTKQRIATFFKQYHIPGWEEVSWYDVLTTYYDGLVNGTFSARASSISYSFFMALFPFILFILNLIPFIRIDNFQEEFLLFINELLPVQAAGAFDNIFREIALQENTGLLTVAFATSIFLMSNGVNAIFDGFERSYHSAVNRGFFRQYAVSLGVSLLIVVILFVGVVTIVTIEYFINELRAQNIMTENSMTFWLVVIRYTVIIFLIFTFVSLLFYSGTRDGRHTSFFSYGATITVILSIILSYLYGIYINNFATYNEIYGSIGALLILMVYIWLNSNLLLLGFELNASIRKLKARNLKKQE